MTTSQIIDPNKLKLVEYLAKPKTCRPMNLKRFAEEELKVSEKTLHKWKNEVVVQIMICEIKEECVSQLQRSVMDILDVMRKKALQGNTAAARLILTYLGELGGQPPVPEPPKELLTTEELQEMISELRSTEKLS